MTQNTYNSKPKSANTSKGTTVTNYTSCPPIAPQTQVPNKTPIHSRTQPEK